MNSLRWKIERGEERMYEVGYQMLVLGGDLEKVALRDPEASFLFVRVPKAQSKRMRAIHPN